MCCGECTFHAWAVGEPPDVRLLQCRVGGGIRSWVNWGWGARCSWADDAVLRWWFHWFRGGEAVLRSVGAGGGVVE